VGLIKFDETDFRSLFRNLVPLAVFIAVLAIQITIFKSSSIRRNHDGATVNLVALLPSFITKTIEDYRAAGEEGDYEAVERKGKEEGEGVAEGEGSGFGEGAKRSENFGGVVKGELMWVPAWSFWSEDEKSLVVWSQQVCTLIAPVAVFSTATT